MIGKPIVIAALAITLAGLTSCSSSGSGSKGNHANVTIALDWLPQPSSGGEYAAQKMGYYEKADLGVTIQPGGTQASSIQIVAGGKAQFGLETSNEIIEAREKGIPVVALAATLQKNPQILVYHAGQHIKSYADLDGRTVYTQISAPEWLYQKKKYHLDGVKDRQFMGSYATFAADQRAVAQGYATSTPQQLAAQGIDVQVLPDLEATGYASVLFTTEKEIAEHPDTVRRFVQATVQGWTYYRAHVDVVSGVLAKVAKRSTDDLNAEGHTQLDYIWTGDALTSGFGHMTAQRWAAEVNHLVDEEAIAKSIDASKAFTNDYLPAGKGTSG